MTPDTRPATEYQRASALYEAGKYQEALKEYRSLAERGSVQAQIFVGWMYQYGRGVTTDMEEAGRWYKKAADARSPEGIFYLGKLCFIQHQYAEAKRHFEDAAAKNYSPAIYRLGRLYELGKGVPIDEQTAYQYFERAAQMGHLFAERAIAGRMIKGHYRIQRVPEGLYRLVRALWLAARYMAKDEHDERIRT